MDERTRRDVLRTAGTAGVAVSAGCLSFGDSTESPADGEDGSDDSPNETDEDVFGPPASNGLETQFRQGLLNTGFIDTSIPEAVEVRWALPTNHGDHTASKGSPLLAPDGNILIADDTGRIRSITAAGEVNWSTSFTDAQRGSHGTPAVADGTAYIGDYGGVVTALSLADGEIEWQTKISDAIGASPTYHDGRLYVAAEFATPSGSVVALDAESGDIEWTDDRPTDHPHSTVAIDLERDRLLCGSNDGHCYAWSFPDLEREWTYDTGDDVKAPIAVYRGVAVVPSWAETVTGVDVVDGTRLWEFETGGKVMCAPAVHDGTAYVGSHDGNVYAIDIATGEEVWSTGVGDLVTGSAVATREHVLAGAYDARLYALSREDGSITWSVEGRGEATSAALATGDAVYYAERAPEDTDDQPGMCYKLVAPE
ncbi:PQQ-binding-like beta-propeller repeat protein [Halorubrum sp. CBA1125]|uniref:outer membrane protein assembly factor BamB family protein n=1 Tax=Halorubrum sp. CBA1125 TaxID=2668072 RepID=UPI0012E9291D|nr:PQQ-binding-like beta-propeller repeat protein [Halorubrum sp. CBA1125]MUW14896.1 PQQ-binding-like beta-propeller repeat protein [Halorubrum sp. CBA1125]